MKAATAKSKIVSSDHTIGRSSGLMSYLSDRIRSFTKVLIAELLCATSSEVA
jgi:hypothetical protein